MVVLNAISKRLKSEGMLPIIFDFEPLEERDLIETVKLLANLSGFIIADITDPQSVPLEAGAVAELAVPFVPLLQKGHDEPFALLRALQVKDWVLPVVYYADEQELLDAFDECVVTRARELRTELTRKKAAPIQSIDASKYRKNSGSPDSI